MKTGLVTIVIPIYNVEKYLNRCIDSVVNQTYQNLEIILVDDGSPDQCPQLCDEWAEKDERIKVVHKKNAGLGMARNTGIENATGEYICFFDSDDYVERETIEKCVIKAKQCQADIVCFGRTALKSTGDIINIEIPKMEKNVYEGEEVQHVILPEVLSFNPHTGKNSNLSASLCSSMYSMQLIHKSGWRVASEREIISEDYYSTLDLYQYVSSVAIISESFYNYCMNEKSLTHTYRKDRYEKIRLFYQKCITLSNQLNYDKEVQHRLVYLYIGFTIGALKLVARSNDSKKEKLSIIKSIINDEQLLIALHEIEGDWCAKSRKILFFVMRKRWCWVCFVLLSLKNKVDGTI